MPAIRSSPLDAGVLTLALAPLILLGLQATAIFTPVWERRALTDIRPVTGFAYSQSLQSTWMNRRYIGDSPAQLFEDGQELAMANVPVDQIVAKGAGRFLVDDEYVYFSTSDGSDPRNNGRRYELYWPAPPSVRTVLAAAALASVSLVWFVVRNRAVVWKVVANPPFWLPATIFVSLTMAGRLWFFLEVPIPGLYGDSSSYFVLVQAMDEGRWPHFTIRTPGYPLFLKAIFSLSDSNFSLMLAQTMFTLLGGVTLTYAIHAYRRSLGLWTALGLSVFTNGLWSLENDTAMLSDSPYSTMTMVVFAFVVLAVIRRRPVHWAIASLMMAFTILVRPAGMFLFVIYLFCLSYLWWCEFGRRAIVAFAVPLPLVMLLLSTYNYHTFGSFAMTAFGESQIAFATFSFWENDPNYPPDVNEAIDRTQAVIDRLVSDEQRVILQNSWDFKQLVPVFLAAISYQALDQASTRGTTNDYLKNRGWTQKIALDSIRKHPDLYLKFVLTQLWLVYVSNINYQEDFMGQLRNRIADMYGTTRYTPGEGVPFLIQIAKEYAGRPPFPGFSVTNENGTITVAIRETSVSRRLFKVTLPVRRALFSRFFWVRLFFLALIVSTVRLALTRGQHPGAFVAFIITISVFGASLVVALVEYGGYRYSYALEYVYYLPTLVLPFVKPQEADARVG